MNTMVGTAVAASEEELARQAATVTGRRSPRSTSATRGRAFNLAYRITGSQEDAADATQDAFLNVLERLPKLKDATSPSAPTSSPPRATPATT